MFSNYIKNNLHIETLIQRKIERKKRLHDDYNLYVELIHVELQYNFCFFGRLYARDFPG